MDEFEQEGACIALSLPRGLGQPQRPRDERADLARGVHGGERAREQEQGLVGLGCTPHAE